MKKLLLALLFLPLLVGCATSKIAAIAEQLKNDPAKIDWTVTTPWGSTAFHREFPTNWTPPAVVFGSPAPTTGSLPVPASLAAPVK